jgi:signal recognition particle subunit SRP54
MLFLSERAQEQYDEEEEENTKENSPKRLGFDDFLPQIQQVKNRVTCERLARMIPGAGKALKRCVEIEDDAFNMWKLSFTHDTKKEPDLPSSI